ncbi:MAG TPA: APC family permease [Blastocatellia bacterium]|nr:APC family permease [Blastocatellia bacterium]
MPDSLKAEDSNRIGMSEGPEGNDPRLIRGVGLASATTLNMIDMIGVGPFITIPAIISAMNGPQAMLGWIFGAVLVMCDGLVWAELGAAMPNSGGPYGFLKEIYNPQKLGRMMSFLFIWQLTFSAPLSIASGCIGLSQYAGYIWPRLEDASDLHFGLGWLGSFDVKQIAPAAALVAVGACVTAVVLLYRKITVIGRLSEFLWVGVIATVGWVVFSGVTHFDSNLAFTFPPDAFKLSPAFFMGLGSAMLIAVYDYWGYYNVCFFGGEVKNPGRTIPRAIIYSIVAVSAIYIVMNISILGVMPWQKLAVSKKPIAEFMEQLYGRRAAIAASLLVIWTAFASVFSLLLGYSRVPYAAALDGNYFKVFSRVHAKHRFPHVSLLVLGSVAVVFCFFKLVDVIAALVVIRIMVQFLAQTIGVIVLRIRKPDMDRPFRMWLYPLPALLAFAGFVYVLISRPNFQKEVRYAVILLIVGLAIYLLRSRRRREWPFGNRLEVTGAGASE